MSCSLKNHRNNRKSGRKKDKIVQGLVRGGDLIDLRNRIGPPSKAMEPRVVESGK